jgi:hypothetical protein
VSGGEKGDTRVNEVWICGDCRSVNSKGQKRCYKCHVPRQVAEISEASAAIGAASAQQARTVLATATRLGARDRPTWPLALLVILLIAAATALSFVQAPAWMSNLDIEGNFIDDPARFDRMLTISTWMFAAFGAALLAWSLWIALVVANVPALTARWPPNSPLGAFFAAWIPIIGLKRPHSVVRGVLGILTEGRPLPGLVALAWWIAVLATYFAPTIAVLTGGPDRTLYQVMSLAFQVRLVLLVVAAVLAVAVVLIIELEQQAALARRATVVLGEPNATT